MALLDTNELAFFLDEMSSLYIEWNAKENSKFP